MNKSKICSYVLLAVFGASAQAQFPFYAPNCGIHLVQPPNESAYYTDENCKTIFVLPPRRGVAKVEKVAKFANMNLCPALKRSLEHRTELQEAYHALYLKLAKQNLNDGEFDRAEKTLALIKSRLETMLLDYDMIPAATAWISYNRTDMDSWVKQYAVNNLELIRRDGINFQPAPTGEGFLIFTAKDNEDKEIPLRAVISAQIPGLRPVEKGSSKLSGDAVNFNGSLSGQVELSLAGGCPYSDKGLSDEQEIAVHLVANVVYTVPLMSYAKYDASLDIDLAVRNFITSSETRSRFDVRSFAELTSEGGKNSAFKFEMTDYLKKSPFTEEQRKNFSETLRLEVRERLAAEFLDQMVASGFLEVNKAAETATAPQPGTVDEPHSVRICHSNWLFGSSCSNHTYTVKIAKDSSAKKIMEKVNNQTFHASESVTIREIREVVHTADFAPLMNSEGAKNESR
jgi:hypothetical protein